MIPTAELLSDLEACNRRGYWAQKWYAPRMSSKEILEAALRVSLTDTERSDSNILAGEVVMELGETRGLESSTLRVYDSVCHHAVLADILSYVLRKPGEPHWGIPDPPECDPLWVPSAFFVPTRLRRVCLATTWSEDRKWREIRAWTGIGEVAVYGLPMEVAVLVIGQLRDGHRNSYWTRALRHPQNKQLRMKKQISSRTLGFNDNWIPVKREDDDRLTTEAWVDAMMRDDCLRDVAFSFTIDVPDAATVKKIRAMADYKLARLHELTQTPKMVLRCAGCPFIPCCWNEELGEQTPKDAGFTARM